MDRADKIRICSQIKHVGKCRSERFATSFMEFVPLVLRNINHIPNARARIHTHTASENFQSNIALLAAVRRTCGGALNWKYSRKSKCFPLHFIFTIHSRSFRMHSNAWEYYLYTPRLKTHSAPREQHTTMRGRSR